jgi:tellurite resistance protein TerC
LGAKSAIAYLTAYLVEESLSVDNLFVFLLIFRYFQVTDAHQHRVLFWGVIGAIVMRFMMIFGGIALVHRFHWVLYIFGGFLVYMGVKLALSKDAAPKDPTLNPAVRLVKKLLPVTASFHGEHFFVREDGRLKATPMLLVLVTVEFSDLVFAIDSIPAVFGISQDLFIILTSNVFAILGLRALYFVLVGLVDKFHYLQFALSFILTFIGIKMLIAPWFAINDMVSLGVVMGTLVLAAMASVIRSKKAA